MYKGKTLFELFLLMVFAIPIFLTIFFIILLLFIPAKGQVFFIQKRIGKKGREFNIFKFRSLKVDVTIPISKDENMLKKVSIPYGPLLRRSGFDELPQIINIIKGEMHFIGPRPLLSRELRHLNEGEFTQRHQVKPGITGLWQLQRKYDETDMEFIKLDLEYINETSLWLDLKILFSTCSYVFRQNGI